MMWFLSIHYLCSFYLASKVVSALRIFFSLKLLFLLFFVALRKNIEGYDDDVDGGGGLLVYTTFFFLFWIAEKTLVVTLYTLSYDMIWKVVWMFVWFFFSFLRIVWGCLDTSVDVCEFLLMGRWNRVEDFQSKKMSESMKSISMIFPNLLRGFKY